MGRQLVNKETRIFDGSAVAWVGDQYRESFSIFNAKSKQIASSALIEISSSVGFVWTPVDGTLRVKVAMVPEKASSTADETIILAGELFKAPPILTLLPDWIVLLAATGGTFVKACTLHDLELNPATAVSSVIAFPLLPALRLIFDKDQGITLGSVKTVIHSFT